MFDDDALKKALKRIYDKKFNPMSEIEENLFNATWETMNQAVDKGYGIRTSNDPDFDFYNELKYNNAVFSAFKVHRMQNDMARQLLDSDGKLKSFDQFRRDTENITDHQVYRWLKTEYDTAVIRAHQAADWKQFEREADVLPNLKWMPSTSLAPGLDHKIFWNRIWSLKDPFWTEHRPGDRWNCKCSLMATDEPVTDNKGLTITITDKPAPGLGGNPGVSGAIFSKDHPYMTETYKGAEKAVKELLKKEAAGLAKEAVKEKKFKSGGVLQVPKEFSQNAQEEKKNLKAYTEMAKMHGEQYKLLNVVNEQGRKNPDAINLKTGVFSDVKVPETTNGKNAIQTSIKSASKQNVSEVVIYLENDYKREDIYAGLKASLQQGRAKSLKTIIVRFRDGELRRFDPEMIRKALKSSRAKNNK